MLLRDVERSLPRMIVLVDHVIAVAEQFASTVRLRSGSPTSSECQDKVLLTLEAAAMGHLLHRQALVVEQILCLHHSPFDDHRAQVHAREHLECIVQHAMFYVEQQGDIARPLCPGLAYGIHHRIDNHLASWLSCVVHFLHALYDMFHCFKGFLLKDEKWSGLNGVA